MTIWSRSFFEILASLEPALWRESPYLLELGDGHLFVFDSACAGAPSAALIDATGGVLDLQLKPGIYRVDHAGRGSLDRIALVRLTPAALPA